MINILKKAGLFLAGLILFLLVAIGFVFQFVLTPEKITPKVVKALNDNLNAQLSLEAAELTFFKTFPSFKLELTQGAIVKPMNLEHPSKNETSAAAATDTLIVFESAVISVNPIAFLRDRIKVNRFTFVNPKIYALVTPEGEVNWDILKETDGSEPEPDSVSTPGEKKEFQANVDLEDISIVNGELTFDDRYTGNYFATRGFDMALEALYDKDEIRIDLNLDSEDIVFRKEEGTFTDNLAIELATDLKVDRQSKEVKIQEALVALNELTFDASGRIQPDSSKKELDVDLDLELKVPTLNTLIDLIPETVFDRTEKYKASGEALITAKIKGVYKKGMIPGVQANLLVKDGSLSYASKPNQIELIQVNADLYVPPDKGKESNFNIHQLRLKGAGTDLNVSGSGTDIFGKGSLDLKFDGKVDLDAFQKTMPFKKEIDLGGTLDMSLTADLDLSDIDKQDYGKIQALGKLKMENVVYENKADSLHFEVAGLEVLTGQDQNSDLLTDAKTKVIGGKLEVNGLKFALGENSSGLLNAFEARFASTPLKDSTKVATMKAALLIDHAHLVLGDSLKARINYFKGDFTVSPKPGEPRMPQIISAFQIDSSGVLFKAKRLALTQARYNLKTTRQNEEWLVDGDISFGTMFAYTPRFPLEIQIPKTEIVMRPGLIELNGAKLIVGQSDITATGRVFNLGDAFFEDGIFRGELEIESSMINVNEMIQALNEGATVTEEEIAQAMKEGQPSVVAAPADQDAPGAPQEPRSFVVPGNLDLRLQSKLKKVLYKRFEIDDVAGLITVKDQKIDLANLQMRTMAAKMGTSVAYTSKEKGKAALNFDFKLFDIDLAKLTELFPLIDSLLPMAESFEGKVNFRMKGASSLDKSLGMVGPSLDAIARVEGDDLVILDGKTFQKIAKMLFFKNKERNTIDKLEFAMIFKNATIEVFPSVITIDRYKVAVGGQHKMDMTYNYHISILKSPMPFKAGIDISGTEDDLDFKVTKAKYKHLFSTKERQRKKADNSLIQRKNTVISSLPFSVN